MPLVSGRHREAEEFDSQNNTKRATRRGLRILLVVVQNVNKVVVRFYVPDVVRDYE